MSKMSEYLVALAKAIGEDVKALVNMLHNLTKYDVGLGNVDNTADINKSVASAGKLTTARTISLTGGVTGSTSFNGSSNVSIKTTIGTAAKADKLTTSRKIELAGGVTGSVNFDGGADASISTVLDKLAVRVAFGGYDVVNSTSADTLVQNFAVGSKMTASSAYQSDAPFNGTMSIVETFIGSYSFEKLQIAYPYDNSATVNNIEYYYGQRLGFVYRRFPNRNPTADQLKWIPLNSSTLTYKNTTNLPSNVYIDKDGVLKRSTYTGSAPVMLSVKLGDSTNNFTTAVAHGLDVSKITKVYARCNTDDSGGYNWIPDGFLQATSSGIQYLYYFTVRAANNIVYVEVYPEAYTMHGKTIDIFIETTI